MLVIHYVIEMKWSNFYLQVPPLYRHGKKWTQNIKSAYKFETRSEAEEVMNGLCNSKNMVVNPFGEEIKKGERHVVDDNEDIINCNDYGVEIKFVDYEVSMTYMNITKESAIKKVLNETVGGNRSVEKPLISAVLKPKHL